MKKAPQVGLEPTTLRLTAGCSAIELLRSNGTDGQNRRDLTRLAEAEKYCQSAFRHPKPAAGCSAIGPTEERNGTDIENRCDLTRLAKAGKQFVNERFGNQNRLFLFLSYAVLPSRGRIAPSVPFFSKRGTEGGRKAIPKTSDRSSSLNLCAGKAKSFRLSPMK